MTNRGDNNPPSVITHIRYDDLTISSFDRVDARDAAREAVHCVLNSLAQAGVISFEQDTMRYMRGMR